MHDQAVDEQLVLKFLNPNVADDEEIEVPGVGGHAPRKAPRRVLSDIIIRPGISFIDSAKIFFRSSSGLLIKSLPFFI